MNYPDEFEELWDAFDTIPKFIFGKKGGKLEAYTEYMRIKPDLPLHNKMVIAACAQVQEKYRSRKRHEFVEQFKNVCRWIKYHRWCDEIVLVGEKKSFVARHTNKSWAE